MGTITSFLSSAWRTIAGYVMCAVMAIGAWISPPICPPEPQLSADHPIIARDARTDNYAATDALGRTLPDYDQVGGPRERFVGLFYWTWHVEHAKALTNHYQHLPVNVTETVLANPTAVHDLDFPGWGPLGMPHHWNEPLFGYYDTDDKWVLRKHAEMLANAGVDVIIFDNTNGQWTWKESYDVLFEVFAEARAQGVNTPKISFMLPFWPSADVTAQLRSLYEDIYKPGRYQDLWFYWKGKPFLMSHSSTLNRLDPTEKAIADFFTFRPGNPSYTMPGTVGKWGWLSTYPQAVYRNWLGVPEQTTVGVAQNHSATRGLTAMNGENVFGRTYTSKGYDTRENAVRLGANFAEQWDYALKVDPEFVFVTGFNEWVAGRFDEWGGVMNAFPDQYNDWFSRDIEPSKGQLGDDYYYQMCDYIRRYKGVRPTPEYGADEEAVYYAYPGNTFDRDDIGYGGLRYTDTTGRNDITMAQVNRDNDNLYFTVKTAYPLSPSHDPAWMRLFIKTGSGLAWEGFQYVIGRNAPGVVEKSRGGWDWEEVGQAKWAIVDGNEADGGFQLRLTIPKAMLDISGDAFTLQFKWSDNMQNDGDVMDFYLYGDTAPLGRFCWVYKAG